MMLSLKHSITVSWKETFLGKRLILFLSSTKQDSNEVPASLQGVQAFSKTPFMGMIPAHHIH